MKSTDVVVVGAGPYGLSLAAHLKEAGVSFRIFGRPMETWSEQMPKGMLLKSDGFASNIVDPCGSFELQHFCKENAVSYDHTRIPVRLDTFARYGMEFQRRLLPSLEQTKVTSIERNDSGTDSAFTVRLETGECLNAKKVVIATGISYYAYVPGIFTGLPETLVQHSSAIHDPELLCDKSVAIVGSGASAIDLAALLHESGAQVTILSRRTALKFAQPPGDKPRSLLARLGAPDSGVGPGWKSRLITGFPGLFRFLPLTYRISVVRRYLGPAAGWPMRDRVVGKVKIHAQMTPRSVTIADGKVSISLTGADGSIQNVAADHVVCATGYKVRLKRLSFFDDEFRREIRAAEDTPLLSRTFESSVPGLFFVGVSAANTFGPVMRFAFGAKFAARVVSRRLIRDVSRRAPSATKAETAVEHITA